MGQRRRKGAVKSITGPGGVHHSGAPWRNVDAAPIQPGFRSLLTLGDHRRTAKAFMQNAKRPPDSALSVSAHEVTRKDGVIHLGQEPDEGRTGIGEITHHRNPQFPGPAKSPMQLFREMAVDHQNGSRPENGEIEVRRLPLHGPAIRNHEAAMARPSFRQHHRGRRSMGLASDQSACPDTPTTQSRSQEATLCVGPHHGEEVCLRPLARRHRQGVGHHASGQGDMLVISDARLIEPDAVDDEDLIAHTKAQSHNPR